MLHHCRLDERTGNPRIFTSQGGHVDRAATHESQKAQVKAVHDKYASAMKAARKVGADSAASVNDREMNDVRALLTSSQQVTFDSYMTGGKRSKKSTRVKLMPARIAVPR